MLQFPLCPCCHDLVWFHSLCLLFLQLDSTLHPRTLTHHLGERKQLKQILVANCIFSRFNLIVYTWKFRNVIKGPPIFFFFGFSPSLEEQDTQLGFVFPWILCILTQFWHNVNLAAITRLVRVMRNFPQNTVESSLTVRPLLFLHTQEQGWMRTSEMFFTFMYHGWISSLPRPDWCIPRSTFTLRPHSQLMFLLEMKLISQ